MGILAADQLEKSRYFSFGEPIKRGSSFELSVGVIIDDKGNRTTGPFVLEPGHMVQVVSREIFRLPDDVTGHVTYKTALTRQGVWALTVGIVDPGWSGPISTTLLNFSQVSKLINRGDTFLRVTLFQHGHVDAALLPKPVSEAQYAKDVQDLAVSRFPPTFMNTDEISAKAGRFVMDKIRNEGLLWLGAAAAIFAIIQVGFTIAPPLLEKIGNSVGDTKQIELLQDQIERLEKRLSLVEIPAASLPANGSDPDSQAN